MSPVRPVLSVNPDRPNFPESRTRLYFPNVQWVLYGPYPLLSVNPVRPVRPVNPVRPTKSDPHMTRGSRTARTTDQSAPYSPCLSTSQFAFLQASVNMWPLLKQNTIIVERKWYRGVLKDPCRFQKQAAKRIFAFTFSAARKMVKLVEVQASCDRTAFGHRYLWTRTCRERRRSC